MRKQNMMSCMTALQAKAIGGTSTAEEDNAVTTLAGSNQAGAVQLKYDVNKVTGAGNAGGLLPANASPGDTCFVANSHASNTIKVYPNTTTGTINGGTGGAAVTIAALKCAEFVNVGSDDWWYVVTG